MKTSFGTPENPIVLKAGVYRVGDPCYSVPDGRWMEWLEKANYTEELNLVARLDGHAVVGLGTAYGDGVYPDNCGNTYGVDAGLIGLVPNDLPGIKQYPSRSRSLFHTITFHEPVKVWSDDKGTLHFGELEIYTGDMDDEEDKDY